MPLDIRALNAFQRILDDPRSTPQDLSQVILNSNLMNMLARQQEEDRAEADQRWEKEFGLQEQAGQRAERTLDANLRQLDENIAALQKRLGMEEERMGMEQERLDIARQGNKFGQGMSLLQMGLQYPGTGFANPQVSQTISGLTGIPLPQNYGQGVQDDTWTGTADPFMSINTPGATGYGGQYTASGIPPMRVPQPLSSMPPGGYKAGAPGSPNLF